MLALPLFASASLDQAFAAIATGGSLIPFVNLARGDQTLSITIVTTSSDQAFVLGHEAVRRHADGARAYCLVVDAYVRVDGERSDAFVIEYGELDRPTAQRYAQPYRATANGPERLGELQLVGEVPSALEPVDPFALDWGPITPDLFHEQKQIAVHVVNHALGDDESRTRTMRFLEARILRFAENLPEGCQQIVLVEDRRDDVSLETIEHLAAFLGVTVRPLTKGI